MIVFKYKNSLERAYAPGIADSGEDGLRGDKGIAGPCMYYVGYDLDNSYSINLALQKIENNILLSDESTEHLPGERTYKNQDLIISTSGQLYMLKNAPEGSTYKFNIQPIGQFIRDDVNDPNPITRLLVIVFTNEPQYFGTTYSFSQRACVPPTNYETLSYTLSSFMLDGVWIMPIIYTTEDLDLDLKLYFNFEKELTQNKLPNEAEDTERIQSINFTKYLEFSDIKASILGNGENTVYFNPLYLSNMSLDKFEPTNKLEYTGSYKSTDYGSTNLAFYKQGVDLDENLTPDTDYPIVFGSNVSNPGTYVRSYLETDNIEYYTKLPEEPADASYGTASYNPAIPAPDANKQILLLTDCNNELIKGTKLADADSMHAGTSEMWSKTSSVHTMFQNFSGHITAEISYTKYGRLYSYTLNNIELISNTAHPEIFNDTTLTVDAPYNLVETPNLLAR